jgi:hypothetical protein
MRDVASIVAGFGASATLLLAAAPAQAIPGPGSSGVTCGPDENTFGREVPNNVTVPPGWICNLDVGIHGERTTVDGNVTVGKGAKFLAYESLLKGNLTSEGAEQVSLIGSVVDGNTSFDKTSAAGGSFFCTFASVCLLGSGFGGNVSITNTAPLGALLAENLILRDLTCKGNASATNEGFPNTVFGQEYGQCVGL